MYGPAQFVSKTMPKVVQVLSEVVEEEFHVLKNKFELAKSTPQENVNHVYLTIRTVSMK